MRQKDYFVDLHCHPTLRPVGQVLIDSNAGKPNHKSSIWHNEPISEFNKLMDVFFTIATYSQSNLKVCADGKVHVINVSLHAPEVRFFINTFGLPGLANGIENYITKFSSYRVKEIESPAYEYFYDLEGQYRFLKNFNGAKVEIQGKKYRYVLISNYSEIEKAFENDDCTTLAVVLNIEGGHCLGCGKDPVRHPADSEYVLKNLETIKGWPFRPLYLTLSHHFYNELAGHAKSLPDKISKWVDQTYKIDTGITSLGEKVIKSCFEDPEKRILIDIKHLSVESRKKFYEMRKNNNWENIPIIYSHGGVSGLPDICQNSAPSATSPFNQNNINIFDDEIRIIADSGGIIGLNLDQRVMASEKLIKQTNRKIFKYHYHWSKLIFNNIAHIAQILDEAGKDPWKNICLGTDYDGVINPINGFWSEERMPLFAKCLRQHLHKFLNKERISKNNPYDEKTIIDMIMRKNAMDFLQKYYQ